GAGDQRCDRAGMNAGDRILIVTKGEREHCDAERGNDDPERPFSAQNDASGARKKAGSWLRRLLGRAEEWLRWNFIVYRRQRRHHALGGEGDDDLRSLAQFGAKREASTMQVDEAFDDRKTEAGALFGSLDRIGALTE